MAAKPKRVERSSSSRSTARFVDSSENPFIYVSSVKDIDYESIRKEIGSLEKAKRYLSLDLENNPKFSKQWSEAKRIVEMNIVYGWKPPTVDIDLIVSIMAFTVEDRTTSAQLYTEMNNLSRELGKSKDSWKNFQYKGWYAMMTHALSALPTSPSTIVPGAPIKCYRGVNRMFDPKHPKKQVTFNCFTSTSRDKNEAMGFLSKSEGTLFEFDSIPKHALGIKGYSQYPDEEEVLLAPWTCFDVAEVRKEGAFTLVKLSPHYEEEHDEL